MAPYAVYDGAYLGDARKHLPKDLKSFFVIRHGVTDANEAGLVQGQRDEQDNRLNQKGIDQATAAQVIIKALSIRKLVSSPLSRALDTAALCTGGLGRVLPLNVEPMLRERGFGKFEGKKAPSPLMYLGDYETCEKTEIFATRVAKSLSYACEEGTLFSLHGDVDRTIMGLLRAYPMDAAFFDNAHVLFFRPTGTRWEVHDLSAQIITSITALELLDNKGRPVLEAKVTTAGGVIGKCAAATGSTVGGYEPFLLVDGDQTRYKGNGVLKACRNVETIIADALKGMNVFDQHGIDKMLRQLDVTSNFSKLGGNAIGSVSQAVLRTAANAMGVPLYEFVYRGQVTELHVPIFNLINGQRSGGRQDMCYEYIVVPYGAKTMVEAIRIGVETKLFLPEAWQKIVGQKPAAGAASGYQAHSADPAEVLRVMTEAVKLAGYEGKVCFAVDCAAVEVFDPEDKTYPWMGERVSAEGLIAKMKPLTEKFNLLFIEDMFEEDDFASHALARQELTQTNIIGDDLTVSSCDRLATAVDACAIDGFVLKINQSGTITDAQKAIEFAGQTGLFVIASGRSGGTVTDPTTDIAMGCPSVMMYKAGTPSADRTNYLNSMLWFAAENPDVGLVDLSRFARF
jgi:enolase